MRLPARRILVSGAAASGKSTLAAALAARLGALHLDADDFVWAPTDPPFTVRRPADEADALFEAAVAGVERWVLSALPLRWGAHLAPLFDLAVYLDLPADVRLTRLVTRERALYGAAIDVGGRQRASHLEFLRLQRGYETGETPVANLAAARRWLAGLGCPVVEICGAPSPDESLARVLAALN